jgi:hypothetical protein
MINKTCQHKCYFKQAPKPTKTYTPAPLSSQQLQQPLLRLTHHLPRCLTPTPVGCHGCSQAGWIWRLRLRRGGRPDFDVVLNACSEQRCMNDVVGLIKQAKMNGPGGGLHVCCARCLYQTEKGAGTQQRLCLQKKLLLSGWWGWAPAAAERWAPIT